MSTPALENIEPFPHFLTERFHALGTAGLSGKNVFLSGTSSVFSAAALIGHPQLALFHQKPQLLIFPTEKEIALFTQWLSFLDPALSAHRLPATEVSPYSGLIPNARTGMERAGWLLNAQILNTGVFVCDLRAFLQKTLPPEAVTDRLMEIKTGDEWNDDSVRRLTEIGYVATPIVEDVGTFSVRGGIVDLFPPSSPRPFRLELFGDWIDSIRHFHPETQRSEENVSSFYFGPAKESFYAHEDRERVLERLRSFIADRAADPALFDETLRALALGNNFLGREFFLPFFFEKTHSVLEHFTTAPQVWLFDPLELTRQFDAFWEGLRNEARNHSEDSLPLPPELLYFDREPAFLAEGFPTISVSKIELSTEEEDPSAIHTRHTASTVGFPGAVYKNPPLDKIAAKFEEWRESHFRILIFYHSEGQRIRLSSKLQDLPFDLRAFPETELAWSHWLEPQADAGERQVRLVFGHIPESLALADEKIVLLRAEDLIGRHGGGKAKKKDSEQFSQKASALNFGDLKPGDLVVHTDHGVGVYGGLQMMDIGGNQSEFIEIQYKDGDKLFIPVYRVHQIQKYSGPQSDRLLDRLGGNQWQNTKIKVKSKLRDIAAELLALYVERSQLHRPPFSVPDEVFAGFEQEFPFEETEDQQRAIDAVLKDMTSDKPMDRLICGDVGFGKTEVAMRATFKAVQDGKQVAVLAPTTVLTYQHFENFKKRFKSQAVTIKALNRFLSKKEASEVVNQAKSGNVDILIGTHRLLSKDVAFKNLGLLIVDEEQKFGVAHKEKIRKLKASVDTLTLSATPIPRTLNMGLMGLRDLSLISTPPVDRLPTRTFICKFNEETIRKALEAEIQRGGQVFFIHNRVQSIHGLCDELKQILPTARFAVAHGQMDEDRLEDVVVDFYNHKIDVLVCTTIIEAGLDIPRANTMFIDRAHTLGLSQLYQLRGRVGRSKQRAYCYLLLPRTGGLDSEAQERLKIIQENSALGSGIKVAHYDLELRGSGSILGADQSGHVNTVGYELYLELFEDALRAAKGEPERVFIEPEINVRIPAFLPDPFIKDIRTRLSYYKTLSQVTSPEEIDRVEEELRDLFGPLPPPAVNLLGLMLLRLICKSLAIRDLSSGPKSISLAFTEHTPLSPDKVVQLTLQENKKYSLTPDSRLKIRMNEITWQRIYEELGFLQKLL